MNDAPSAAGRRVLVIGAGPGQAATRAALDLHAALRAAAMDSLCLLTAPAAAAPLGVDLFQRAAADVFFHRQPWVDPFFLSCPEAGLPAALTRVLQGWRPDIVHLQHPASFGLEGLLLLRRALPGARLLLTLHDHLLPCGQGPAPALALLEAAADPEAARRFFPERSAEDVHLRRIVALRFLAEPDALLCPTAFSAARHAEWGIPAERLHVLPALAPDPAPDPAPPPPGMLRLAWLGPFPASDGAREAGGPGAGLELLLAACDLLPAGLPLRIELCGAPDLAGHAETARRIAAAAPWLSLAPLPAGHRHRLAALQPAQALLVTEAGWDDPGQTLALARAAHRPVIGPRLGAVAEAVRDGVDGLLFRPGSALDLAQLLIRAATEEGCLPALQAALPPPPAPRDGLDRLLALYEGGG
ncbi:glycosyltransferase [Pseudoroseomonas cervicalis]|uniref:glycosyltransferase n=1 Tax=Teichococcus cervicalis TaxID=204525 RepID=UPI002789AB66|nr:glycosyltransferase [Pseudoroseomonas cervicalis]MDQ1079561.1 glycosyltransferase involved in cell wall biosynthesis [Pseudoroseomonas cervicalis]